MNRIVCMSTCTGMETVLPQVRRRQLPEWYHWESEFPAAGTSRLYTTPRRLVFG